MDRRWRAAAEFGPAVLFTVLTQIEIWVGPIPLLGGTTAGARWNLATFVGVISVGLALRLRRPLLGLVLVMGPMATHWPAQYLFSSARIEPNLFEIFLAEVFIVYSTSAHTSGRRTWVAAGLVATIQLLTYGPYLPGALNQSFGEWVFYSIAWALGKTVLQRERRGDRLEARTAELERAREEQIAAAVADERARIARELHDVVAHSVSLMVLQAGAARQALEHHPEKARAPLLSVEATGRAAMSELRRLVAVLRQPGEDEDLAPQPSIRDIELLVGQMREAGLAVAFDSDGGLDDVPPGVDLSAYRIAQEALTNALKHSGAKHVELKLRCSGGAVEVAVEDDGRGPSPSAGGNGGHGLIGMRERVNLFGGHFEAGRREGGGFRVYARLPYEAA
jgi:signal transduction histidine kinase